MSKYILSIDGATRTLGYIFAKIDTNYVSKMEKAKSVFEQYLIDEKLANKLSDAKIKSSIQNLISFHKQNPYITILLSGVKDLLNGDKIKKYKQIERMKLLVDFIKQLIPMDLNDKELLNSKFPNETITPDNLYIILEQQWAINKNSGNITHAIIAYFLTIGVPVSNIIMVMPNKKNSIAFAPELSYNYLFEKYKGDGKLRYKKSHIAKLHSVSNMKLFYQKFGLTLPDISSTLYEHLADAFMQMCYIVVAESF